MRNKLMNNTSIEARHTTKKMLVVLGVIFFSILFIGTTSAFEFDNVKNYDEDTKTVDIRNSILGIPFLQLGQITTATLNTPQIHRVGLGYQKVAQFTLNPKQDYNNILGSFEFYDKKDNDKQIQKQIDIKYLATEMIEVPTYEERCWSNINKTQSCANDVQNGTKLIERETWKEFNNSVKTNKEIIIGLFTTTYEGEHIEWIPEIAGVKVPEWSEWTASLNVGLLGYWKLDETSGTNGADSLGVENLTASDARIFTAAAPGIINGGADFSQGDDFLSRAAGSLYPVLPYSVNAWVNLSTLVNLQSIVMKNSQGNGFTRYGIRTIELPARWDIFVMGASTGSGVQGNHTIVTGQWYMITLVANGTDLRMYVNGSLEGTPDALTDLNDGGEQDFFIGKEITGRFTTAVIDEVSVWNRSLSVAEVTQLYNNGNAISHQSLFVPTVTLNFPIDTFKTSNPIINFNGTVEASTLTNVSLFINGIINETNSSGIEGDYLFTKTLSDGNYNWTYEACSPDGCVTATTRTFTIDTVSPIVTVTSPTGDQGTFSSGRNLSLDWMVIDANPDTCWYEYQSINTTVTCSLNITNLTVTDSSETFLIFWANDTIGQQSSDNTTWGYSFIENNVTFNGNVSETSSQFFELNLSTSLNVLSITANLNYDGSTHISNAICNGNCIVNNTIAIPLVASGEFELKEFFWNINIFNGTDSITVNTSTQQQNVTRVHLENCGVPFTVQSLNFTVFDEQNLTRINPFRFDGTFDIWLGEGSVKRNNSFSNSSIAEKTLCISPNSTFFTDAQIEYNEPANVTYVTRDYYFQNNTISNVSQSIPLFLLKEEFATSFILLVQDDELLPLENHLVEIQRFYPGENIFRTVQIAKTGTNGKTVGFFETETVDYRFIIKHNGTILLTTIQQKIVGEIAPFTITFTIGEDLGKPWGELEGLDDLVFTLDFDKSTNIVTYTYVDTSTEFTLGTLVVERQNFTSFSSNINICNVNSSQSSATLFCNISAEVVNFTGTYVATGLITRDNIQTLVAQINFIIESFSEVVGFLGVLLAWFIILISAFAFRFNEIAGLFMINATVIFVNLIGLVSFGLLSISALIAVSVIIVVVMKQ